LGDSRMSEEIKKFVREKDFCVMATSSGGTPHCSLMAYVSGEDEGEIYMVTHRNTTKYRNLLENPSVSLLVDTREDFRRGEGKALTIEGIFQRIDDEAMQRSVKERLLDRHPNLEAFLFHPDAEPFCIKIRSFLLLEGPTKSRFVEL
jgi:nitroimidazol reductase NimA-like FMN-containing flavoprotein (pyridoxamine 5'-phosphate oxidase superfamily)